MGLLRDIIVGALRSKARRGNMISKRGRNTFYKGRGARSTGVHTSKGYIIMKSKIPEIIVPDLTDFMLKPYVSYRHNNTHHPVITKENYKNWMRRPWGQAKDAANAMTKYIKRVAERDGKATAS